MTRTIVLLLIASLVALSVALADVPGQLGEITKDRTTVLKQREAFLEKGLDAAVTEVKSDATLTPTERLARLRAQINENEALRSDPEMLKALWNLQVRVAIQRVNGMPAASGAERLQLLNQELQNAQAEYAAIKELARKEIER